MSLCLLEILQVFCTIFFAVAFKRCQCLLLLVFGNGGDASFFML